MIKKLNQLIEGLLEISKEIEEGRFVFRTELEDVHMNIERALMIKLALLAQNFTPPAQEMTRLLRI